MSFNIEIKDLQLQMSSRAIQHEKHGEQKKWVWQTKRAIASVKPWNFGRINLDISGLNYLSFRDGVIKYDFESKTEKINIDIAISELAFLEKLEINVEGMKIGEKLSKIESSITSAFISMQSILRDQKRYSQATNHPSRALQLRLKGVYLPANLRLLNGNHLENVLMKVRIIGDINRALSSQMLGIWRDSGGIIDIESFEGYSGSIKTYGTGTLALDQDLQPLLAMSLNIEGIIPLIDRLKTSGFIRANTALLAKIILGGILKRSSGKKGGIKLPLTIQDRELSVGPLSLMTLPSINWDKVF